MNIGKQYLLPALALLLAGALAGPALAKEPQGLLRAPQTKNISAAQSEPAPAYTAAYLAMPFAPERPAGLLQQVTQGDYTFQMPVVWEMPEQVTQASVEKMLDEQAGSTGNASGVAFLTLTGERALSAAKELQALRDAAAWIESKGSVETEYLRAAIGDVARATVRITRNGTTRTQVIYYPLGTLDWSVVAVTAGDDSEPTAEQTAAYMVYTLQKTNA